MKNSEKRFKILIVDDMPEDIHILIEALKDNYITIPAINGKSAIQKALSDKPPDLILLDIIMPGMDGYEVCRQLKHNEKTKDIPIIFITARDETMDEVKAFGLGGVDYITKPFKTVTVKARIKTHIELKAKNDMLAKLASIDGLTEIYNRRKFDETLHNEWKRSYRQNTELSLLLIDIDYFKYYNDHYGHSKGDECLKIVAKKLQNALVRNGDTVCRYGGEEFIVVLPGTDLKGALHVAEKLREEILLLNIPHEHPEIIHKITISAGAASTIPKEKVHPEKLLEAADAMMYKSKQNGRNQVSGTELR